MPGMHEPEDIERAVIPAGDGLQVASRPMRYFQSAVLGVRDAVDRARREWRPAGPSQPAQPHCGVGLESNSEWKGVHGMR